MKKANILKKLHILWVIVYTSLWLSILALYRDTFRGGYTREYGNEKLNWWAGKIIKAGKINLNVKDLEKIRMEPGKRYIIMSNHRSHYDIPVIMFTMPWTVRMVAKSELFKIPIWGRGMKHGEFISIDRKHIKQAKKDLDAARKKMESGVVIWMSPEGGRSRTGKLRPFKKGGIIMAIEAGATIIPVGIQGTEKVLKPDKLDFYLGEEVTVSFGTPIEASVYDLKHKDGLLEEVRAAIAGLTDEEYVPGNKEPAVSESSPAPEKQKKTRVRRLTLNRLSPYVIFTAGCCWIWSLVEIVQASLRSTASISNAVFCVVSFLVLAPFVWFETKTYKRKKSGKRNSHRKARR